MPICEHRRSIILFLFKLYSFISHVECAFLISAADYENFPLEEAPYEKLKEKQIVTTENKEYSLLR